MKFGWKNKQKQKEYINSLEEKVKKLEILLSKSQVKNETLEEENKELTKYMEEIAEEHNKQLFSEITSIIKKSQINLKDD